MGKLQNFSASHKADAADQAELVEMPAPTFVPTKAEAPKPKAKPAAKKPRKRAGRNG